MQENYTCVEYHELSVVQAKFKTSIRYQVKLSLQLIEEVREEVWSGDINFGTIKVMLFKAKSWNGNVLPFKNFHPIHHLLYWTLCLQIGLIAPPMHFFRVHYNILQYHSILMCQMLCVVGIHTTLSYFRVSFISVLLFTD